MYPKLSLTALYVLITRVRLGKRLFVIGLDPSDVSHLQRLKHSAALAISGRRPILLVIGIRSVPHVLQEPNVLLLQLARPPPLVCTLEPCATEAVCRNPVASIATPHTVRYCHTEYGASWASLLKVAVS